MRKEGRQYARTVIGSVGLRSANPTYNADKKLKADLTPFDPATPLTRY